LFPNTVVGDGEGIQKLKQVILFLVKVLKSLFFIVV
jgi:hypothetical protein